MKLKDWLEIVIIPVTLALIAILWPVIQNRSRRRIFTKLILRELTEISRYPDTPTRNGWWEHCQKRFIHREIFNKLEENRDFILSLDPTLVYLVADLWRSLDDEDWDQWIARLQQLKDFCKEYEKRDFLSRLVNFFKKKDEKLGYRKIHKNIEDWETLKQAYDLSTRH